MGEFTTDKLSNRYMNLSTLVLKIFTRIYRKIKNLLVNSYLVIFWVHNLQYNASISTEISFVVFSGT